jgi:uncharacterized protein
MNCPVCKDAQLVMTERQGIEIDYCPGCRGVWLDRGELDKIIDRSLSPSNPVGFADSVRLPSPYDRDHDHHKDGYRRKSFFKDLFD